VYEKHGKILRT